MVPDLRFIGLCDRGTLRRVRLCLTIPFRSPHYPKNVNMEEGIDCYLLGVSKQSKVFIPVNMPFLYGPTHSN